MTVGAWAELYPTQVPMLRPSPDPLRVTMFGDKAFRKVIRLSEVIKVEP